MKQCSVEECNEKHDAHGYCKRHNDQMRLYGKILKRTRRDPNKIIEVDNICWISLYNKYNVEIATAKFYTIYKNYINKYKWHLDKCGYVVGAWCDENNKWQKLTLHGSIIFLSGQEVPDGYEIDHKDGDKLNCLDENLRICLHLENGKNIKLQSDNTSGYKGVGWHKKANKWRSQIAVNGKHIHLGLFDDKITAAKAYNTAAIKYHGVFAQLNPV